MDRQGRLPLILLVTVGVAVYLNSFSVPFLFDDFYHIVENPRIRDLLNPVTVLTSTTRPVVALTLAVNYALGGLDVFGYHLFNLGVHLLAALTLFGVIRRTLLSERLKKQTGDQATELALVASLLWLVHPLQTESVTYLIQRGESLMGLFYLLTLYCVIRGRHGLSVLCCALGMLAKPVMVTAPAVLLVYDRIFLSSSWKELFRKRGKLYLGLAAAWLALPVVLIGGAQEYQGLVGMHLQKVSPSAYLWTQPGVILHYLRLSFWPHPLVLDYQWPIASGFKQILIPATAVLGLLALTAWGLRRHPAAGFLGIWFFGILAPTSSFLPVVDPAFEHRMYLPLAAVILAFLAGLRFLLGRRLLFWAVPLALIPLLTLATVRRNEAYGDPVLFWQEEVSGRPGNARACVNLGAALQAAGRSSEAADAFRSALAIRPDFSDAHNNLGYLLLLQGKPEEAYPHYQEALRLSPNSSMAHKGMGMTLQKMGRMEEAAAEYAEALRLNPVFEDARTQLDLIRKKNNPRSP